MMPVPSLAGTSTTVDAPCRPILVCEIVLPFSHTCTMCFLASAMPLSTAMGTSLALPYPTPTLPLRSPTTTRAAKLNRRPPLTTFAQR